MSNYHRRKGHSWEREVAKMLRDIFPDAARQLEYQENECNGIDLKGTGSFKIQCKCSYHVPNIPRVFDEFKGLRKGDIPVVAFKVDGKGMYAALKIEDLIRLMKLYNDTFFHIPYFHKSKKYVSPTK